MVTNTMIVMVTNSLRCLRGRLQPTGQERTEVVLVRHGRQASKQVPQVGQGILPVPFAGGPVCRVRPHNGPFPRDTSALYGWTDFFVSNIPKLGCKLTHVSYCLGAGNPQSVAVKTASPNNWPADHLPIFVEIGIP